MNGLMMQQQLLVSSLIEHAARYHGDTEIVSRRGEGDLHRTTYRELRARARMLADALSGLGVQPSQRVATLAWNGYRHMELYYAISGMGAVMHTINPRLHIDQVAYMLDHAEDQYLFFDLSFLPLVQALAARGSKVRGFVALCAPADLPEDSGIADLLCYETLLDSGSDAAPWPVFDEQRASTLCYTSGTTGNPKGVLYSHRSTMLHAFAGALPDALNCSARDVIMPVVPMFHVNAWGLPYVACMVGAKLVFPGPAMDGKSLYDLLEAEQVTVSAGVPTIWQGLLAYADLNRLTFSSMRRTVIGGAACPPAMLQRFQHQHDVQVLHAWGMTELSPLGTVATLKGGQGGLTAAQRETLQGKQGRVPFGIDMQIVGGDGRPLPWDGATTGELMVRGHWVIAEYFRGDEPALSADRAGQQWFATGDVANIDRDGYMQITDRSKDVIKSGGEWISSIELENIAMAHPAVAMAACIGVPHPKWDERPLLVVVRKPGHDLGREELIAFYDGKIAKWWTPDDVVFAESIPLGATGKMLKSRLREQFSRNQLTG